MDKSLLSQELELKAVTSSGPGGQHVNKVATKIQLRFDVYNSQVLTPGQMDQIPLGLKKHITKEGVLLLQNQSSRSQLKNKKAVVDQFFMLVAKALKPIKKRKKSSIPYSVKKKRQKNKRLHSDKKKNRSFRP